MLLKASNTGKTITLRLPDGSTGLRFVVGFLAPNRILLKRPTAEAKGYKVTETNCITFSSAFFPDWPSHARVELEMVEQIGGDLRGTLPAEFEEGTPKVRHKEDRDFRGRQTLPEVGHLDSFIESLVAKPEPNVVLTVDGESFVFNVPNRELLHTAIAWGSKNYAVV